MFVVVYPPGLWRTLNFRMFDLFFQRVPEGWQSQETQQMKVPAYVITNSTSKNVLGGRRGLNLPLKSIANVIYYISIYLIGKFAIWRTKWLSHDRNAASPRLFSWQLDWKNPALTILTSFFDSSFSVIHSLKLFFLSIMAVPRRGLLEPGPQGTRGGEAVCNNITKQPNTNWQLFFQRKDDSFLLCIRHFT